MGGLEGRVVVLQHITCAFVFCFLFYIVRGGVQWVVFSLLVWVSQLISAGFGSVGIFNELQDWLIVIDCRQLPVRRKHRRLDVGNPNPTAQPHAANNKTKLLFAAEGRIDGRNLRPGMRRDAAACDPGRPSS